MITVLRIFGSTFYWTFKVLRTEKKKKTLTPEDINPIVKGWGSDCLRILNVETRLIGNVPEPTLSIFVGNHISYLDIVLVAKYAPVSFVAKTEIRSWPLFGWAANSVKTVWIKRESKQSRAAVTEQIQHYLKANGQSICLFPSGTTSMDESKPWKRGAFNIAQNLDIPLQPFRIRYTPLRTAAFIDDDALVPHLLKLAAAPNKVATIEFHPPMKVTQIDKDIAYIREWIQKGS